MPVRTADGELDGWENMPSGWVMWSGDPEKRTRRGVGVWWVYVSEAMQLGGAADDPRDARTSLCSYGILSASTFAWCSAYYANLGKKSKTFFIAPKYWEHHRSKKITKNYITDFIHYI